MRLLVEESDMARVKNEFGFLSMRPLTEDETKLVFTKLANYIVSRFPFHFFGGEGAC